MKLKFSAVPHLIRSALILIFACCCLEGCFGFEGPRYPAYGNSGYGYAPYSYGFPQNFGGYSPMFGEHHDWEEHHQFGHNEQFWHGPIGGGHGGEGGHFGGGHGGGDGHGGDGGHGGGGGDHH